MGVPQSWKMFSQGPLGDVSPPEVEERALEREDGTGAGSSRMRAGREDVTWEVCDWTGAWPW